MPASHWLSKCKASIWRDTWYGEGLVFDATHLMGTPSDTLFCALKRALISMGGLAELIPWRAYPGDR